MAYLDVWREGKESLASSEMGWLRSVGGEGRGNCGKFLFSLSYSPRLFSFFPDGIISKTFSHFFPFILLNVIRKSGGEKSDENSLRASCTSASDVGI